VVVFFDREAELDAIVDALQSNRAELVIVYGRRGVGKSELLVRAMEGREGLYYQATEEVMAQQLADIALEMRRAANGRAIVGHFDSIGAFFAALTDLARAAPDKPFAAVIDEFPYLAEAERGVETALQRWWDRNYNATPNLKVFLAGSHVSWMREHTLSEHGPIQNRRTKQVEVRPLDYRSAALFYPLLPPEDRVRAYAMWGGLPGYLREIDPHLGLWANAARTILRPNARLSVEPDWLRFTDLRADRLYNSLVRAIAMGAHMPGDIARAVGRHSAADVIPQLGRLIETGVVERTAALATRDGGRPPTRYDVADTFLAFWYRFVDPRRGIIRRAQSLEAAEQIASEIAVDIDEYIGRYVFEGICREWVWLAAAHGELPAGLRVGDVGTWWGGRDGAQDELDVVALTPSREGALYGECKWSVAPMDMRDLGGLRAAIDAAKRDITPIDRPWRALFSRSGFHADLRAEAAITENRIILVGLDQLYE